MAPPVNLIRRLLGLLPVYVAVIILISLGLEKVLHKLGAWFTERQKKALFEALEKVKAELMILGFISLLLTFGQVYILKICIPIKVADTLLPCPAQTTTAAGHRRKLLWMYANFIHPISGPHMWPAVNMFEICPPIRKRQPRRPKKNRVQDVNEPSRSTMGRKHSTMTCGRCRLAGHNSRMCKEFFSTSGAASVSALHETFMDFHTVVTSWQCMVNALITDRDRKSIKIV